MIGEGQDGPPQHRQAVEQPELLGDAAARALAHACGDDQDGSAGHKGSGWDNGAFPLARGRGVRHGLPSVARELAGLIPRFASELGLPSVARGVQRVLLRQGSGGHPSLASRAKDGVATRHIYAHPLVTEP